MFDYGVILEEAHRAAFDAVEKMGPENPNKPDCGSAWITVSGNEPLVKFAKIGLYMNPLDTKYYGEKAYPNGWQWLCPGGFKGWALSHHEAGARAFREVLARYNIPCVMHSRFDL